MLILQPGFNVFHLFFEYLENYKWWKVIDFENEFRNHKLLYNVSKG